MIFLVALVALVGLGVGGFCGFRLGRGVARLECAAIIDSLEASVKSGKPEGVLAK